MVLLSFLQTVVFVWLLGSPTNAHAMTSTGEQQKSYFLSNLFLAQSQSEDPATAHLSVANLHAILGQTQAIIQDKNSTDDASIASQAPQVFNFMSESLSDRLRSCDVLDLSVAKLTSIPAFSCEEVEEESPLFASCEYYLQDFIEEYSRTVRNTSPPIQPDTPSTPLHTWPNTQPDQNGHHSMSHRVPSGHERARPTPGRSRVYGRTDEQTRENSPRDNSGHDSISYGNSQKCIPGLAGDISRSVFYGKQSSRGNGNGNRSSVSQPRPTYRQTNLDSDYNRGAESQMQPMDEGIREEKKDEFMSARDLLYQKEKEKSGAGGGYRPPLNGNGGSTTGHNGSSLKRGKSLGGKSRRFEPPFKRSEESDSNPGPKQRRRIGEPDRASDGRGRQQESERNPILDDERLAGIDEHIAERILIEVLDNSPCVSWDDIAGLEFAKSVVKEIVIMPMLRPDIFTGLRAPPKGLLLFGPPGTGKTLIGKAIASQSKSTFFSISASSMTSKWVGEGEKLVRALFAIARIKEPSVIFVDEIDSLLSSRTEGEVDASRRIKTEFLVQMDGAGTDNDERILLIGATNRPQELDEAMRRRLVKRLYIPLPDSYARRQLIRHLLREQHCTMEDADITRVVEETDGYSGFDLNALCREAALGPLREVGDIMNCDLASVPPITYKHFKEAQQQVRPSVSSSDLNSYVEWNTTFGSFKAPVQ